MKRDLDQLMAERDIDAAIITGGVHDNASMYYMINGAHVTHAIVVKRQGTEPILIHQPMERDESAASGLDMLDFVHFDFRQLAKESENSLEATVKFYRKIFEELDVSGRVGFYGRVEQGASYALLTSLEEALPDVTIIGEYENDIFTAARATKGPEEIERMRRVGEATTTVIGEIVSFIQRHEVVPRVTSEGEAQMLIKQDGTPLTIGDIKRYGRNRLFVYGLEDSEGMIFSQGSDAGVPHSRGKEDEPMYLGRSIVFDLFPREMGGGYFHDVTRTFCIGYAPPEVHKVYEDVLACFQHVMKALEARAPTRRYEEMVCDIFEDQGHNTHRSGSGEQNGYVHSLGHGVGLDIHERPAFGLSPSNQDTLQPGAVVTIEPGLYYPEQGYGVRIEDTVYLDENGTFHSLTDYPKDLVIEI